jgi:hypothetical protein
MDVTGHVLIPEKIVAASSTLKHGGAPWGARRLLGDGEGAADSKSGDSKSGDAKSRGNGDPVANAANTAAANTAAKTVDPMAIAAGATIQAVARDEAQFETRFLSKINEVGSVIGLNTTGGQALGPVVMANPVNGSLVLMAGDSNSSNTATQEEEPGIGIRDIGKDVTVPDPFANEADAENTLVSTYRRVGNASSIVALLAMSNIVIGAVWVLLLGRFTTVFVYATLFSLPMCLLASAMCLVVVGVNMLWSLLLMACFVASVMVIYLVKERVALTAGLLTCSSKALIQNFPVLFIAVVLSMVQVLWLFACFLFIGLSFLSGEAVRVWVHTPEGTEERCVWQTDGWAYVGMFFVIFVMLWTNSIIGEIKRYTVSGAIGLWYYGELPRSEYKNMSRGGRGGKGNASVHNAVTLAVSSPATAALGWSLRTSFGSVCFSALVSSTCEMLKLIFRPWNYDKVLTDSLSLSLSLSLATHTYMHTYTYTHTHTHTHTHTR